MRRVALLLVPLLLFACDRTPVAPDIAPTFGATKSELVGSGTESFSQYLTCIDEVGEWSGPFSYLYTVTTTPSGNELWQLSEYNYLEGYQMVGQSSGDVWTIVNPRVGAAQSRPIGTVHFIHNGNLVQGVTWIEQYENQDGDRLVAQAHTQVVIVNGEVIIWKADFSNCRLN